jgi:hypothetical protein
MGTESSNLARVVRYRIHMVIPDYLDTRGYVTAPIRHGLDDDLFTAAELSEFLNRDYHAGLTFAVETIHG